MEAMREAWTDERLDDLNGKVDQGFRRVDADIRELRGDMNDRFDKIDDRLYAIQRTMLFGALALSSAFVAGFAALVGLFATQI
jgi:hypothetical protein